MIAIILTGSSGTNKEKTVMIFDEAQDSYDDLRFWANFVKPTADRRYGPMIALFSSYGGPPYRKNRANALSYPSTDDYPSVNHG